MLRLLLRWFLQAGALLLVAYFVPGFHVRNFPAALVAALVIGLLNATLGLLLKLITLPLGILTLGLFFLVVNAIILEVASAIVPGFQCGELWSGVHRRGRACTAARARGSNRRLSYCAREGVFGTATPLAFCVCGEITARPSGSWRTERGRPEGGGVTG